MHWKQNTSDGRENKQSERHDLEMIQVEWERFFKSEEFFESY